MSTAGWLTSSGTDKGASRELGRAVTPTDEQFARAMRGQGRCIYCGTKLKKKPEEFGEECTACWKTQNQHDFQHPCRTPEAHVKNKYKFLMGYTVRDEA